MIPLDPKLYAVEHILVLHMSIQTRSNSFLQNRTRMRRIEEMSLGLCL